MGFYRYLLVIWSVITILTVANASVNIALRKATNQSSIYRRLGSSKAVDGCASTYMNSYCCILTAAGQTEAWWQVDLQTQSVIDTVDITYRDQDTLRRLAGYEMYLSNKIDWTSGNRCYKDTTADLAFMSPIQYVTCKGVARYLTIYTDRRLKAKPWYSDYAILELCEVQVFGCQVGKYGNGNCDKDCINCLGNICHPASGTCDDCAAGYYTVDGSCIPCPVNCEGNTCDSINGDCSAGCMTGFSGIWCRCPVSCKDASCSTGQCTECYDGYYGQACTPCPSGCSTDTCDKTSGQCVQCDDGLHGRFCRQPCPANCKHNVCTKDNGHCIECDIGFYGNFCNLPCPDNCKNNVCNQDNSQCTECDAGFYGSFCRQPCSVNCNNVCNKDNGLCIDCNDGYYGPACTPCPSGCSTNTCDKTSGHCFQCDTGFYGSFCRQPCSVNCKNNVCNKDNGLCIECDDGLHGSVCRQPCPANCKHNVCTKDNGHCKVCVAGFHGSQCLKSCGKCQGMSCDKDTGNCATGCPDGWTGDTCDTKEMNEDAAVGVGVGLGVVILALVFVIIALVRRLTMKRGDTTKSTHMTDISSSRTANELNEDQDDNYDDIANYNQEQIIVQISNTEGSYEQLGRREVEIPHTYETINVDRKRRCTL